MICPLLQYNVVYYNSKNILEKCETSGSHAGEYEDGSLMGYSPV
jgi:hypothetical protein